MFRFYKIFCVDSSVLFKIKKIAERKNPPADWIALRELRNFGNFSIIRWDESANLSTICSEWYLRCWLHSTKNFYCVRSKKSFDIFEIFWVNDDQWRSETIDRYLAKSTLTFSLKDKSIHLQENDLKLPVPISHSTSPVNLVKNRHKIIFLCNIVKVNHENASKIN